MPRECKLCKFEKLTSWHFEEEKFIVMDCIKCEVPMYVWKSHIFPTEEEVEVMVLHAKEHFPDTELDFKRRAIPEHYHFHAR